MRTITPSPRAPLTAGEFRQGPSYTNWRPEGSGDWLLIYTAAGSGTIVTEDGRHELAEGQALLYQPTACQDYTTSSKARHWHLFWAHFMPKTNWAPWLIWPEIGRHVGQVQLRSENAEQFAKAVRRLVISARLGGTASLELGLNALEEALIWVHRELRSDNSITIDARISRAIAVVAADPTQKFVLEELARNCGLSNSRFGHLFKAQLQMTPSQFIEKLRLELAAQFLAFTGMTISEVAYKSGFDDPSYFSRRFVRAYKKSPKQYRDARVQPAK